MSELTQQEQAFFESGGETSPEAAPTEAQPEVSTIPVAEPAGGTVETTQEKSESRTVPLAVLMEERANAKALKNQLAQLQQQQSVWEARFAEMNNRLNPRQETPSFDDNPAEHLRSEVVQTKAELQEIKRKQEEAQQDQQFALWYQAQAADFAQSTPDFISAYNAFTAGRYNELIESGIAPNQIDGKIRQEEKLLAAIASQLRINPAQLVYQAALAKGYKPAASTQGKPTVSPQQKLQMVAEGVKSSKSLSQVPGKPVPNLTAEYVLNMSPSEWKQWSDNWEENMSKL